jgi:hypothetical protein
VTGPGGWSCCACAAGCGTQPVRRAARGFRVSAPRERARRGPNGLPLPCSLPFGSQNRTPGEAECEPQATGCRVTCGFVVGVAGFEPAASSSRSQRAMWPATTLTLSDLPRAVRGRPLASADVCGGCYSVSYSPAKGACRSDGGHGPNTIRHGTRLAMPNVVWRFVRGKQEVIPSAWGCRITLHKNCSH